MLNLTFGEQVKIVLSRKGMTIKELAEQIEARTGKKMSRQNLTQRLGRDNFQEQDMRMIAEILGCSFQLSILASLEAEKAVVLEEELPTEKELGRLAAKKEMKALREEKKKENERDLTVGEFVEMLQAPVEESVEEIREEEPTEEIQEEIAGSTVELVEEAAQEVPETLEEATEVTLEEAPAVEEKRNESEEKVKKEENKYSDKSKYFQPIKQRKDLEEDRELGEINPYTGREYQTNSVRTHPKRIGYVQVYDRREHKWTDMTEWAFIGMEENKKATLGKEYEPPIYLD